MPSIYLNQKDFYLMMGVAAFIHIVIGIGWAMTPSANVNKIPVHVLKIKLGSGEGEGTGTAGNTNDPQAPVAKISTKRYSPSSLNPNASKSNENKPNLATAPLPLQKPDNGKTVAITSSGEINAINSAAPVPSQYVRGMGNGQGGGSAIGNSVDPAAEVMHRYTQLISMWINRHRSILNKAMLPGMKGNIIIRLRIDRQGNIHFFKLDKATGVPSVDAAAVEMVRAANPVPPIPSNYPGGNMFEFLIPVGYTFQQ